MKDWNLVVTIFQDGFRRALRSLRVLASIERTPYHNVLAMKVDDPVKVLEAIELKTQESTALYDAIREFRRLRKVSTSNRRRSFWRRQKAFWLNGHPDWPADLSTCDYIAVGPNTILGLNRLSIH